MSFLFPSLKRDVEYEHRVTCEMESWLTDRRNHLLELHRHWAEKLKTDLSQKDQELQVLYISSGFRDVFIAFFSLTYYDEKCWLLLFFFSATMPARVFTECFLTDPFPFLEHPSIDELDVLL